MGIMLLVLLPFLIACRARAKNELELVLLRKLVGDRKVD